MVLMDRRSVMTALLALAISGCAEVTPSPSDRPTDTDGSHELRTEVVAG